MKLSNIAIHGVPRSGTSWIGAIFDSSKKSIFRNQPLFSYTFKSFLDENSNRESIKSFFNLIANSNDELILQKESKNKGLVPTFSKNEPTHIIYKEARYHHIIGNLLEKDNEIKVVGIIRNPKSVISSWINAPKEFDIEKWDIMSEWRMAPSKNKGLVEEFYGYNKWKEVALLFISLNEKYPKQFYLINYKDLLNNTEKIVNEVFSFCELKLEKQTLNFLNNEQKKDKSKEAYSVFRVNQLDNKWENNLPKKIVSDIDEDLMGTKLEKYLY